MLIITTKSNVCPCLLSFFEPLPFKTSPDAVDPKSVKSAKELPYMQRPGGSADDSDIGGKKKKKAGFSLFSGKKKEPKVEREKKKNPWTF